MELALNVRKDYDLNVKKKNSKNYRNRWGSCAIHRVPVKWSMEINQNVVSARTYLQNGYSKEKLKNKRDWDEYKTIQENVEKEQRWELVRGGRVPRAAP